MRASKAISVLPVEMPASPWRVTQGAARKLLSGWSLRNLFARKPPSLYQRCLAVHIYHASQHRSLH